MKANVLLTLLILSFYLTSFGQRHVALQNKNTGKIKRLKSKTFFVFETKSDTAGRGYYQGRIVGISDTLLLVDEYVKPHWPSRPQQYRLAIQDIRSISNELVNNSSYNLFPAFFILAGTGSALIGAPLTWAREGSDEAKSFLAGSAVAVGVGGLLILPNHISRKYRMSKWKIIPAP
jgi:hypothetical protein